MFSWHAMRVCRACAGDDPSRFVLPLLEARILSVTENGDTPTDRVFLCRNSFSTGEVAHSVVLGIV